ncbi:hypothetical protein B0T22DRAFT_483909 [Podospora appendiculata]|uniref:Uncharacterized protein n=1 Tax=Podospora appendiculata TaxID=314037 RepID=A0AAE0X3E2_9PEZI|nr:hypothetical protein B0T22DRAFT_483909 [Podospora appendiculata]
MSPATPFRPTMHFAARPQPAVLAAKVPVARVPSSILLPSLVVVGTISGVVLLIRSQLRHESKTLDRMFAQQNTPEVMESRRRTLLIDTEGDPRRTIYNALRNW